MNDSYILPVKMRHHFRSSIHYLMFSFTHDKLIAVSMLFKLGGHKCSNSIDHLCPRFHTILSSVRACKNVHVLKVKRQTNDITVNQVNAER